MQSVPNVLHHLKQGNKHQTKTDKIYFIFHKVLLGELNGLMVIGVDSKLSSLGSSPSWGHCVVFLRKTLYSHSASLCPGAV